ncbi:MAG: sel1 repeat family protein [Deltaproteobacteria bacterium]|nr:sel1 repeat family protein [Deltaproteobacteria bacterium]
MLFLSAALALAAVNPELANMRGDCQRGDAAACRELARRFEDGDGLPIDGGEAARFYRQACKSGDPEACGRLGHAYHFGDGVTLNHQRAADLYMQACQMGHSPSCRAVADLFISGDGVAPDATSAMLWYEHGCELGDGPSCTWAGISWEIGQGTVADPLRAAELYRTACALEDGAGCGRLARMVLDSEDRPLALRLAARGCAIGDATSCGLHGRMTVARRETVGTQPIRELLTACHDTDLDACEVAARALRREGSRPSLEAAARAWEVACACGVRGACHRARRALNSGRRASP